jgi:hypothetical protein
MVKPLTYIVCGLILLAGCFPVQAQETPSVKASVDKNQILIGEPLRLTLDVKSPMASGNILPQFDSLPHFEMIEKGSRDSLIGADGASYHLEWKLTSFDSGTRFIPSFSVVVGNQVYKTDSLVVEVSYGNVDTSKDYHDIKGIIDIPNPGVKYIPWAVGVISLVALLLFVWFIRRPLRAELRPVTVSPDRATPLDEAMASLDLLKKMQLDEPSSVKKYYTGLNDTLRIFLNHRLGIVTMEKTSEELIHSVSGLGMEREAFSKLTAALRMGDFVKFAKYIPGPYENGNNLDVMRSSIVQINETGE